MNYQRTTTATRRAAHVTRYLHISAIFGKAAPGLMAQFAKQITSGVDRTYRAGRNASKCSNWRADVAARVALRGKR